MEKQETVTLVWTKEQIELAMDCLKRNLPQNPLLVSESSSRYCCPICLSKLVYHQDNFCSHCGQSLEWDEVIDWAKERAEIRANESATKN